MTSSPVCLSLQYQSLGIWAEGSVVQLELADKKCARMRAYQSVMKTVSEASTLLTQLPVLLVYVQLKSGANICMWWYGRQHITEPNVEFNMFCHAFWFHGLRSEMNKVSVEHSEAVYLPVQL